MSITSVAGSYASQFMTSLLSRLSQNQSPSTSTVSYPSSSPSTTSASQPAANNSVATSSEATLSDEIIGALVMMQAQSGAATTSTPTTSTGSTNPIDQLFASLDSNGDGTISQSEMESAIEGVGGTAAEADQIYTALGGTSTTGISQSSFETAAQSGLATLGQMAGVHGHHHHHHHHGGAGESSDDLAAQILSALDNSQDGTVSASQLTTALGSDTSGSSASNLVAAIDGNGSGTITQSELASYLNGLQTQIQGDQSALGAFMRLANQSYTAAQGTQSSTHTVTA
jgi:Ca2+-binding EF-hand superfamily protein